MAINLVSPGGPRRPAMRLNANPLCGMDSLLRSQDYIRTALVVGAIWLFVTTVSTIAISLAGMLLTAFIVRETGLDLVVDMGVSILGGLISILLFAALPGWFLLTRADRWSVKLAASSDRTEETSPGMLHSAAILILGLYLLVSGGGSLAYKLASLAVGFLGDEPRFVQPEMAGNVASTAIYLFCGFLVYRKGTRAVAHVA
jgi:hypothetical protein